MSQREREREGRERERERRRESVKGAGTVQKWHSSKTKQDPAAFLCFGFSHSVPKVMQRR